MSVTNSDTIPNSLANNLGRVDEVIEDGGVHGLQSPGPAHITRVKSKSKAFNNSHFIIVPNELGQ